MEVTEKYRTLTETEKYADSSVWCFSVPILCFVAALASVLRAPC
jgi:hypothetical protein